MLIFACGGFLLLIGALVLRGQVMVVTLWIRQIGWFAGVVT